MADQIVWRKRPLVRKVIKETVLDHGPDGDLRVGEQLLDGIGQQMGCGVANDFQSVCSL